MEAVQEILIHTYHPDPNLRKHAEEALNHLITQPGSLFALLTFLGTRDFHRDLRQAAGIVVKNRIAEYWRRELGKGELSDAEKEQAKTALVEILLAETDNSIRGLIAESIKAVGESDFPEK
jgi:hypothetical protein